MPSFFLKFLSGNALCTVLPSASVITRKYFPSSRIYTQYRTLSSCCFSLYSGFVIAFLIQDSFKYARFRKTWSVKYSAYFTCISIAHFRLCLSAALIYQSISPKASECCSKAPAPRSPESGRGGVISPANRRERRESAIHV